MNRIVLAFTIITCLLAGSCSNDFDLVSEWKDIPVVYGLISPSDSVHYVRVEKAFLDESTSALEIAKNTDSLFYPPNVTVRLEEVDGTQSFVLDRIDASTLGINREDGVFATNPNILYTFVSTSLQGGEEYQLLIERGDNLPTVTASTIMVDDLRFSSSFNPDGNPINWLPGEGDVSARWRFSEQVAIYDFQMNMKIKETNTTDGSSEINTYTWLIENTESIQGGSLSGSIRIDPLGLYIFLGNTLERSTDITREFMSYNFEIVGGSGSIAEYLTIGRANTGITSSQILPTFTNLSEGVGIFSSINNVISEEQFVTSATRDELSVNSRTQPFNFLP